MPYIGNQHNVGDHVNNFKVLDDISSHTATFDGSATSVVSTTNNTIRVPLHRFIQGQRVTYTHGGGGNIGGLTSGTAYFVSFDSANTIRLATSLANANSNTVINLSSVGSGTSHTLNAAFDGVNTKFKMTHGSGKAARLNNATQINVAINNVIQRPNIDPNNFTDGFALEDNHKIVFKTAPTVNDIFWGSIIANTIENFDLRDNEVDNFTGDGTTTEFSLSTIPANNESVIVSINGVVQHPSDKNNARSYTLINSIIQFTAAPALNDEIQVRHIGFAGASTNDVSGFYGRTGNVALTSSDHITTGDITARNFKATGITTFGTANFASANFSGNVSIGGTLTYEDVTNIDSVGIGTFGEGIFVPDDKSIRVGGTFANPDFKIHSSSTYDQAVIDYNRSGTGRALRIRATNLQIENWNGLTPTVKVIGGVGAGHVELNYAGSKKFETTTKGIQVGTGVTIETNGQANFAGITTVSGTDLVVKPPTVSSSRIKLGYAEQMKISVSSSNQNVIQSTAAYLQIASNNLLFARADTNLNMASFKAGQQCKLTYNYVDRIATSGVGVTVYNQLDTTNLSIAGVSTFTGNIDANGDLDVDGHTNLDNVSVAGVTTHSDDVKFTGNNYNVLWDKSDNSLKFDALAKIKLNDSFQFYHNTNGVLHNTSGITFIYGSGSNISIQAQVGAQNIACAPNGGTSLYYQGNQKLYTVSDGVYINDNLGIQDSIQHVLDTNTKIRFPANDTVTVETAGSERLRIDNNGNMGLGTLLASDAGSAGAGLKIEKYVQRNNIYAFPDGWYGASLGEVQNTENKVWASIDSHYARSSAISAGLFLSAFHQDAGGSGCGSAIKNLKTGNALTFSTVTTGASVGSVAVETERLRITNTGDILTSGNTQLFGSNTSDGSDNKAIMINGGGAVSDSRGGYLLVHGNEHSSNPGITRLHAGNVGTAYIAFNTSGTERLRITSAGKVLIGNGSTYTPSGMLHIVGDDNSNGPELYLMVPNNNATDNIGALVFGNNIDKSVCMIRGSTHTANNTGEIQFHTSTTGTMSEKLRITSHGGTIVNKGGSPNTASGWAGLEVKAAASEHQLVLSSTDTASNSNQVRLGFKLHPSNDNERVKAAIVCQGSGGGYGEVSRMMFCIDSAADNGSALPNSASDEKLRITSSGLIQIGGDISNVADIDTSNTKLTIKQSANSVEDGIYIERSGERRGHYIYVGGAHGVNDGLCFSTNQLGGKTDILALDRSGAAYLGGSFYPNGDNNHDIGSDAKTWRKFYIQNMYPEQGTQQATSGSSFASSSWYDVGYERGNMGGIDLNGTYIITLFADTWAAGGGNYSCNYTWIVGMRNQSTNQNTSNNIPLLSVTGHSTNGNVFELRTTREGAVYGGNEWLQWRCTANLSAINSSSGRIMYWRVQRIGRSSTG